ncbi:MAG: hypothetical protein ACP5LX_06600 [Nitrososphaeria archaeon]|jgi:hypothetical protein
MSKEQYTSVQVSRQTYEKIKERLAKSNMKITVSSYIESIILENLETSELMSLYGPFLSYVGNSDNTIFINDWKQRRIAGVSVNMKEDGSFSLFCDLDQSENCVHVGFVFALPQFYKILKEKGLSSKGLKIS